MPLRATGSYSCIFSLLSVIDLLLNVFEGEPPCLLGDHPSGGNLLITRIHPQRIEDGGWLLKREGGGSAAEECVKVPSHWSSEAVNSWGRGIIL
jgi:hypothetical protein